MCIFIDAIVISVKNELIDPVTFEVSTSKQHHFYDIPRSFTINTKIEYYGWDHSFMSYADRQTNKRSRTCYSSSMADEQQVICKLCLVTSGLSVNLQ